MYSDTLLLIVSAGFASALVLTEPEISMRLLAVGLFAIQVLLFWVVAMPYHEEKDSREWLDNIELM